MRSSACARRSSPSARTSSRRSTSTKACRTPSTPITARATARKPQTTAGSACSPGSGRTAWRERAGVTPKKGAFRRPFLSKVLQTLVRVLPRLFNYRTPLRDFGLEELAQGFRPGAIRAHRFGAEPGEVSLEVRVLDRVL